MKTSYRVLQYLQSINKINHYAFISVTSQYEFEVPQNLLNYDNVSQYHSLSKANQMIIFDFPVYPVFIEGFILKTSVNRDPKNWVLEGTNNYESYTNLYTNANTLMCKLNYRGFCTSRVEKEFNTTHSGYFRQIRLRQTGVDSSNENMIVLSGIDFIGKIELTTYINTNKNHIFPSKTFLFTYLIYCNK